MIGIWQVVLGAVIMFDMVATLGGAMIITLRVGAVLIKKQS